LAIKLASHVNIFYFNQKIFYFTICEHTLPAIPVLPN
jgi:hypothetical protein